MIASFPKRALELSRKTFGPGGWGRTSLWALGGVAGAFLGGWFGLLIGLLISFMTRELIRQLSREGAVRKYLEFPGPAGMEEGVPGLAAFCGIAAVLLRAFSRQREGAAETVVAAAAADCFLLDEVGRREADFLAREALAVSSHSNCDLLIESFLARAPGRARAAMNSLEDLAEGREGARGNETLERIRVALGFEPARPGGPSEGEAGASGDPYLLLGVKPGMPLDEIKNVFRQLAVQFHPDALSGLDEERSRRAGEAFIKIEGAYREILRRERRRRPG